MQDIISSTSLARKLGIKNNAVILVLNQPKSYMSFFKDFPLNVLIEETVTNTYFDLIHIFVTSEIELTEFFTKTKPYLNKKAMMWISWPKKSSQVISDISQSVIRNFCLKNGLVDVKVVSIDKTWSGLKFVYRLKDR